MKGNIPYLAFECDLKVISKYTPHKKKKSYPPSGQLNPSLIVLNNYFTESAAHESAAHESAWQHESAWHESAWQQVSTAVESAAASVVAAPPQENKDTLNTTASNKTNFFIFKLIKL
jgi:hypothetical protein